VHNHEVKGWLLSRESILDRSQDTSDLESGLVRLLNAQVPNGFTRISGGWHLILASISDGLVRVIAVCLVLR
jgi:hypothetical protein